ncbi:Uncharacterized protein BCRIVMBC938_04953 [Bacillus wiedmannii]|nr:Uncharacterized protein BCRIVMBC938_04953 [Bacillus wiedmannii]
MEQIIHSIDAFALDTVLQGQTYSSAKAYFLQTFRPLAQGIIYLCEELIRQNDAFPRDFQSQVASTDVIEQEILEQIRKIDRMIASTEALHQTMPISGMDAIVNLFAVMRRKLQEKLEHLYEFNQTSSDNYNTAIQLAASIAAGLAEVQSGKGFSPASGTFSTQGLNMEWATSVQAITEERSHQAEKLEDKEDEKSMLEKAWDAIYYGSGQAVGYVIEGVPKIWNGIYVGSGQAVGDVIEGVPTLFEAETWLNAKDAIINYDETLPAMYNALSDSFINDVINGDAESIARWGTYTFMQVAGGGILSGAKGVMNASKVSKISKVTEITLPRIQPAFTNLVDNLSIENRFAFSDTNGLNLRPHFDSSTFNKAEDKMVFARTTDGKIRVKDVQEVIQDYADKVLDRVEVKNEYPDSYTASQKLRAELKEAGIEPPPYSNAAHHLTPWNDKRAVEAQELLKEFGIHHDSAANGVFLPYKVNEYVTTEVLHIGNHSTDYMKEVTKVLKEVKEYGGTQADAVAALHDIRTRLLDGSLKLNSPK